MTMSAHLLNAKFIIAFVATLVIESCTGAAIGQYNLGISSAYIVAFDHKEITFQNSEVSQNFTQGINISINNSFRFKESPFEGVFKMGFQQLYFSGDMGNLKYNGNSSKIILALGARYYFNPKIAGGIFMEMVNNLNFEDYRSKAADIYRYSICLEAQYLIFPKTNITVAYSRALYPLTSHYLIFNPINQIRMGFTYNFL